MSVFDRTIALDASSMAVLEAIKGIISPALEADGRAIVRIDQLAHLFRWTPKPNGTTLLRYWIHFDPTTALDQLFDESAFKQLAATEVSGREQHRAEKRIEDLRTSLKRDTRPKPVLRVSEPELPAASPQTDLEIVQTTPAIPPSGFKAGLLLDQSDMNLMTHLDFTADDLALNRQGRLSEHQLAKLRPLRWKIPLTVPSFILLGILVIIISQGGGSTAASILFVIFGLGLTVFGFVLLFMYWFELNKEIKAGEIATVTGAIKRSQELDMASTSKNHYSGRHYYFIEVDQQRFPVALSVSDGLQASYYRLYYSPQSMVLLALERVEAEYD